MAVVLGNLPFLPDTASCRTLIIERRTRPFPLPLPLPLPFDIALNLSKRDAPPGVSNSNSYYPFSSKGLELEGDGRNTRAGFRGKVNSKVNEVEFDSNSSDEENRNGEEEEPGLDWDAMMRKRVKELESEKELEKKAEELQGRLDEERRELGVEETEEDKKMRVKKELEKLAKEQAERRETAQLMFDLGQKAYGRGMYGRAIEFLEAALTIIPRSTLFGGEIQIWLAMAYEANNRHDDCIDLYEQLEWKHPSISIRRQAAELRYIMQAPKIKITQEEMVSIPLIGSPYDNYAGTWSDKNKNMDQPLIGSRTNQLPSSRDYLGDVMKWKPPVDLEKNQAFWVTLALWMSLVAAALFLQR